MHYSDSLDTPRNNAVPPGLRQDFSCSPTCTRCRATTPACCWRRARRRQGRHRQQAGAVQGAGDADHRQPARQVDHEQVAQPGAGHLPAPRREQGKQGDRHRRQGAGRFGRRLAELRAATSCRRIAAGSSAQPCCPPPHGSRQLPHPAAQQRAVRAAAVHAGRRPDADLRHHGRGQPRARQLLHAGRLPGLVAVAAVRQPGAGHRCVRRGAGGGCSACCWSGCCSATSTSATTSTRCC